jgi:hypothetical protein
MRLLPFLASGLPPGTATVAKHFQIDEENRMQCAQQMYLQEVAWGSSSRQCADKSAKIP